MRNLFSVFVLAGCLYTCTETPASSRNTVAHTTPGTSQHPAKFEPEDGRCILFVGQELEAIGGLDTYSDGYIDHFDIPGGFTMYTTFMPGSEEFGFTYLGLDGITTTDNWGDGESNMSLQLADPDFTHLALAIGLKLVDHAGKVADGSHDSLVVAFGHWLQGLGQRPVFLRIGYEFDGHDWNHYDRNEYIDAFHRIVDIYDSMKVENVAYVWHSAGWGSDSAALEAWYPGDEYVDWCAYSHFARGSEAQPMLDFARRHGKPVFIAEASPTLPTPTIKTDGKTLETLLSNPQQAQQAWEEWFVPFFQTIHDNPDVIKAISYINANWRSRPMWKENPTFQDIDARLHLSDELAQKWREETSKSTYIRSSPELFEKLYRTP